MPSMGVASQSFSVEAVVAAVQVVFAAFVLGHLIRKLPFRVNLTGLYAVAHPADERADVAVAGQIAVYVLVAQHHVAQLAVPVGHVDGVNDAAEVGDLHRSAGGVLQDIQVGFTAAGQFAKGSLHNAHAEIRPFYKPSLRVPYSPPMIHPFAAYFKAERVKT